MIKEFLMKQLLKRKLKNLPEGQRDQMMNMVMKNPDLFKKIGDEIENKKKHEGKNDIDASIEVMKKYQNELRDLMS